MTKNSYDDDINSWNKQYESAPEQLEKMKKVSGALCAFNSNIDAVIKISGARLLSLCEQLKINLPSANHESKISCAEDALHGLVKCFSKGIAEEWLIDHLEVFHWLEKNIGHDKLQMGGQGGIVANALSVCDVQNVYVHCASLPKMQADLFLGQENLKSMNEYGKLQKACTIDRKDDVALIHWIIEFDKGDSFTYQGETFTCPRSNRFIATYDPLNFQLHIDPAFAKSFGQNSEHPFQCVILSGYHMLQESHCRRIDDSLTIIKEWQKKAGTYLHLEVASTQDKVIRRHILEHVAKGFDGLGLNERETIDLLEVMNNQEELAKACEQNPNAVNLFQGIKQIFDSTQCQRIQLHMFGLYLTLQRPNYPLSAENNKQGMMMAATIAAAKAKTGSLEFKENLLKAHDEKVSSVGIKELTSLAHYFTQQGLNGEKLNQTGILETEKMTIIAVPTKLIDKPLTLVGMGDTISSLSLVGAIADSL